MNFNPKSQVARSFQLQRGFLTPRPAWQFHLFTAAAFVGRFTSRFDTTTVLSALRWYDMRWINWKRIEFGDNNNKRHNIPKQPYLMLFNVSLCARMRCFFASTLSGTAISLHCYLIKQKVQMEWESDTHTIHHPLELVFIARLLLKQGLGAK